jgi:predicted nucleic acid-binding protein
VAALSDAVVDAVALAHHFRDTLPPAAERIFRDAENGKAQLFLPEIALGEFIYTALRGRLSLPDADSAVSEILDQIRGSGYLTLSSLGTSGWGVFLRLKIPELHDRMIAADALSRGVPVVTNDPELGHTPGLTTIWREPKRGV